MGWLQLVWSESHCVILLFFSVIFSIRPSGSPHATKQMAVHPHITLSSEGENYLPEAPEE